MCGNSLSTVAKISTASNCDSPCSGAADEICGGTYYLSLFSNEAILATASASTTVASSTAALALSSVAALSSTSSSALSSSSATSSTASAAAQSTGFVISRLSTTAASSSSALSAAAPTVSAGGSNAGNTTTAADSPSSSSSSNAGPIAGGVIGGLAALALIGLLVFCCKKRQRRRAGEAAGFRGGNGEKNRLSSYGAAGGDSMNGSSGGRGWQRGTSLESTGAEMFEVGGSGAGRAGVGARAAAADAGMGGGGYSAAAAEIGLGVAPVAAGAMYDHRQHHPSQHYPEQEQLHENSYHGAYNAYNGEQGEPYPLPTASSDQHHQTYSLEGPKEQLRAGSPTPSESSGLAYLDSSMAADEASPAAAGAGPGTATVATGVAVGGGGSDESHAASPFSNAHRAASPVDGVAPSFTTAPAYSDENEEEPPYDLSNAYAGAIAAAAAPHAGDEKAALASAFTAASAAPRALPVPPTMTAPTVPAPTASVASVPLSSPQESFASAISGNNGEQAAAAPPSSFPNAALTTTGPHNRTSSHGTIGRSASLSKRKPVPQLGPEDLASLGPTSRATSSYSSSSKEEGVPPFPSPPALPAGGKGMTHVLGVDLPMEQQ